MKVLLYYLLLLVAIALVSGFILSETKAGSSTMSMPQVFSLAGVLALYTIAMSFVGEGKLQDEREGVHRHIANRAGLIAGTVVMAVGVIVQLLITHNIDYWLLAGLIVINLTKIVSLIWLNYKK